MTLGRCYKWRMIAKDLFGRLIDIRVLLRHCKVSRVYLEGLKDGRSLLGDE